MNQRPLTGGCQCGAVRFAVEGELGSAGVCHCRMCQKAFGAFYAPLVEVNSVTWTHGEPARYRSSNAAQRGFCRECGTPLTFEPDEGPIELAMGAFDDPTLIRPTVQHGLETRIAWLSEVDALPGRTPEEIARTADYYASIRSFQHPDHDS